MIRFVVAFAIIGAMLLTAADKHNGWSCTWFSKESNDGMTPPALVVEPANGGLLVRDPSPSNRSKKVEPDGLTLNWSDPTDGSACSLKRTATRRLS